MSYNIILIVSRMNGLQKKKDFLDDMFLIKNTVHRNELLQIYIKQNVTQHTVQ